MRADHAVGDAADLRSSGYYRKVLDEVWANWPPQFSGTLVKSSGVQVQAWESQGNPDYIGLQKKMLIQAPMEKVDAILQDFDHYTDLFPEFKEIKVIRKEEGEILTHWERPIPFPFVPNVHYETAYRIDRTKKNRVAYRIHLKHSNRVYGSDDLLVIEQVGPNQTEFQALSFFEADWGPVRILGQGKIWKDSIEGSALSDLSFKVKAEHPDLLPEKIHSERKKLLPEHFVADVYDRRKIFDLGEIVPALKGKHHHMPPVKAPEPSESHSPSSSPSPSPSVSVSSH